MKIGKIPKKIRIRDSQMTRMGYIGDGRNCRNKKFHLIVKNNFYVCEIIVAHVPFMWLNVTITFGISLG